VCANVSKIICGMGHKFEVMGAKLGKGFGAKLGKGMGAKLYEGIGAKLGG